jgi:predicted ATPase
MKNIRLVNIRSLVDSGLVPIAPVTVLVGQNSSGKSTFARFFPLLRQSAEVLAREPLLWFGRFVDFGSAEEATSRLGGTGGPGFDVTFDVDRVSLLNRRKGLLSYRTSQTKEVVPVTATVRYLSTQGDRRQMEFGLSFLDTTISIQISDVTVTRLLINGADYSEVVQGKFYAANWSACFPNLLFRDESAPDTDPFTKLIASYVRSNTHGKSQADRVAHLTRSIVSVPLQNLLLNLKNPSGADSMWHRNTAGWSETSLSFKRLRDWIVGSRLSELFQIAGGIFNAQCTQIKYITPIRASAERYYRRQGLALGEIDPQGQNVAMFLHNLSAGEKQRFISWMGDHFGYTVDTVATSGHISMVIRDANDQTGASPINLADTGFGFSQMVPILMQIWSAMTQRSGALRASAMTTTVIAIEQPELHLHPRLQAILADLFIQAVKLAKESGIDLRLVIETHSEQMINRLGRRVSESVLLEEEVAVVLFDKPKFAVPTDVKVTGFDNEGFITDWPYGFFEASN